MVRTKGSGWLLGLVFVVAVLVVLAPLLILNPDRAQSAAALQLALGLKRWSPSVLALAVLSAGLLARRVRRIWGWALAGMVVVVTVLGSFNVFEWMFAPVDRLEFAVAADLTTADPEDMLLCVKLGGESRAYPVRMMAYHHIVNDVVGGVPIVATY
jgi:hypothetical protein